MVDLEALNVFLLYALPFILILDTDVPPLFVFESRVMTVSSGKFSKAFFKESIWWKRIMKNSTTVVRLLITFQRKIGNLSALYYKTIYSSQRSNKKNLSDQATIHSLKKHVHLVVCYCNFSRQDPLVVSQVLCVSFIKVKRWLQ